MNLSDINVRSPGILEIWVLNPLALDAAVPPISVSVFCNFEDVELAGQTGAVNLPIHAAQILFSDSLVPAVTAFAGLEAQGKTIRDEAIAKSSAGVISGPAKAVTSALGYLSVVPSIGIWSSALAIITNAVAGVAEQFGYCKPNTLETTAPRMNRRPDFSNTEGVDTAAKMQLIPSADVSSFDYALGGSKAEMQMLHIASTPSLLAIFEWTGNDAPEDVLFITPVTPMVCHTQTDGSVQRYFNTMLRWVASTCEYWRGSIRFDMQITCSNFHSGRVRISFMPKDNGVLSSLDHQQCINRVIDLQNETEISFTIPYIDDQPWKRTRPNQADFASIIGSLGTLQVTVINDLTHASLPIPPVHFNMWISAGPDFQLAMPTTVNLTTIAPIAPLAEELEVPMLEAQGLTQMEMKTRDHPPLQEGATGSLEIGICNVDTVTHIKQVTNRPTYTYTISIVPSGASTYNLGVRTLPNIATTIGYNFMHWMSEIFTYTRGAVNVKILAVSPERTQLMMGNVISPLGGFIPTTGANFDFQGRGFQVFQDGYNPNNEVTSPYYGNVFGVPVGVNPALWTEAIVNDVGVKNLFTSGGNFNANIYEATGDDFTYHYLVGPPSTRRAT
jgi:hypothetical protein